MRVLVFAIFFSTACLADDPRGSLKQVHILFKHGDRTPLETFPTDPNGNHPWEGGLGALTMKGKQRMRELGEWLREEYGGIANNTFEPDNTRAISSSFDRCLVSTKALLAGLSPDPNCPGCLLSEKIPVSHNQETMNTLILLSGSCQRLMDEFANANAQEKVDRSEKRRQLYQLISQYTGKTMSTPSNLAILHSSLNIQLEAGLKLASWANSDIMDKLQQVAGESLALFTHNTVMKRLRAGPILKHIIKNMRDFTKTANTIKMYLYGLHDVNLVNVARAIGVPKYKGKMLTPNYGAVLAFELWENKDHRYYVVVKYMDDSRLKQTDILSVPACRGNLCYFDEMESKFSEHLPVDWKKECQSSV